MVWLAKWIREHQKDARVLLITDRTELDDQIERRLQRCRRGDLPHPSGADLIATLNQSKPWLICSLIHKFRGSDDDADHDEAEADFIKRAHATVPTDFSAKGNLFVFVDEAHRTQSGKMHDAMKQLLPGAMFIGFTGTPLLKTDKATSIETFGCFIHTYKFDEAVARRRGARPALRGPPHRPGSDLAGEGRQVVRRKDQGMTDLSKAQLKKRWGTMQKVVSSEPRAARSSTTS